MLLRTDRVERGAEKGKSKERKELEATWYQISPLLGEPLSQAGSVKL